MNDTEFHAEQMAQFAAYVDALETLLQAPEAAPMGELLEQFKALMAEPGRIMDDAPALVGRLFTTAPGLAQNFPRDLLWYLGGECLHYMPDDEIERYGALDDQRRDHAARGADFNWREARAASLKLQ